MPFTRDDAALLLRQTIDLTVRHTDYARVNDLRTKYMTILTGVGYETFLSRFVRREGDTDYKQRLQLTYQNLSSTSAPMAKGFDRINQIQDLKKGLVFENTSDRDQKDLTAALEQFAGVGISHQGTLEDYLALYYNQVSLYDPNGFIVLEFGPFNALLGERAQPYGVFYDSEDVLNFRYTFGQLDYLIVKLAVSYRDADEKLQITTDILLYSGEFCVRYYKQAEGRIDLPQGDVWVSAADSKYTVVFYELNVAETPAVRLGYMPDPQTNHRSCVSPLFHPALDLFRELINLKSQNDLIVRLHGFPKRTEYAPVCPGEFDEKLGKRLSCNQGKTRGGANCKECGGTGFIVHRTEQDVLLLAMPENAEDMLKLNELSYVDRPDFATVEGLDKKITELEARINYTVFSSDLVEKTSGPVQPETATAISVTRDDLNNTLLPFADHKSQVYKALARHIVALMQIGGEVTILYEFPRDLRLSSLSELYADLKAATDSGAMGFVIDQITDDIARKLYESDPDALQRYFFKKKYVPYLNQTLAEFEYYDSTGRIPQENALIRANEDVIFGELEQEVPGFYQLPYIEALGHVMDKVTQLQKMLPKTVSLSDMMRQSKPEEQQPAA